jgi:hypothetical protein
MTPFSKSSQGDDFFSGGFSSALLASLPLGVPEAAGGVADFA